MKPILRNFVRPTLDDIVTRVSTDEEGGSGNGISYGAQVSADGRYVVFTSEASNLVADDENGVRDVFRKDLRTNEVVLVATTADGTKGNGESYEASISADGRYVVFTSTATDLVTGDTNDLPDVFRKDLQTGEIVLVSGDKDGNYGNSLSHKAQISADGRYVTFMSEASNLVAGDENGVHDIFRKDLETGRVELVSVAANGTQGNAGTDVPHMSADGRYVVYQSRASNLGGNTSGITQIFRKDLETGELVLVSSDKDGRIGNTASVNPWISDDGRFVLFESDATNLVANDTNNQKDVFCKNLETGEITLVSSSATGVQGNIASLLAWGSADGRYAFFSSAATNLVANDKNGLVDIFRKDLQTNEIVRISTAPNGAEAASGSSYETHASPDGRFVTFRSRATNLDGTLTDIEQIYLVDTKLQPHHAAIGAGRFVNVTLDTGSATQSALIGAMAAPTSRFRRMAASMSATPTPKRA